MQQLGDRMCAAFNPEFEQFIASPRAGDRQLRVVIDTGKERRENVWLKARSIQEIVLEELAGSIRFGECL